MALPAPTHSGRRAARSIARAGPRLAAVACCLVVGAAACSSDGDTEPEPTTGGTDLADLTGTTVSTGTSAPGTTAATDEEAAVLEAVDGYWRTWLAANDPPDPDHPDLEKYATGANLEQIRRSITESRTNGIRILAGATPIADTHNPKVVEIANGEAMVHDCFVDDLVQVSIIDGSVIDDQVVTQVLNYRLLWMGESWKIENVTREARWDDGRACS